MPTAQKLINIAAGKRGIGAPNTDIASGLSADFLVTLNSLLDSWRIDRLMVYQIVGKTYTWPGSTASRTIGSSGNFNTTRPDRIEEAFWIDSDGEPHELDVVLDRWRWDGMSGRSETSEIPIYLFYDEGFPLATINLTPVPSAGTLQLNVWQVLQSFAALADNLLLPPGYQRAIECNLAVELPVGNPITPALALAARESKAAIKRFNSPVGVLSLPPGIAGRGRSNIFTG